MTTEILLNKGFPKTLDILSLSNGDQKLLITIRHTHIIGWWSKVLGCLKGKTRFEFYLFISMVGVDPIVIEKIWSPSNRPPLSDGNQIFQSPKNRGNEGFPKTYDAPSFNGNWKVSIGTKKGDHRVWQLKKFGHCTLWWRKTFWLPYPITTKNFRSPQGLATKKIWLPYPMAIETGFGCHTLWRPKCFW